MNDRPDPELEYKHLRVICSHGEDFGLAIAVFDDEDHRARLIERVGAELTPKGVKIVTVNVREDPDHRRLIERLTDELAACDGGPVAFHVIGIEKHIAFFGKAAEKPSRYLSEINLNRELFRDRIGRPVIMWCTPLTVSALAQQTPDFWHWRTSYLEFLSGPDGRRERLLKTRPESFQDHEYFDVAENERRITHYRELLAELATLPDSTRNRRQRAELLVDLGLLESRRGEKDEALGAFHAAREIFAEQGNQRELASTSGRITDILRDFGQLDEALRIRREEILPISEQIGDKRLRAVTMGKIADILYDRGDLDEALRIRQEEELPFYEQIGDTRSRAVTMGRIANILYDRGDLDEALRVRREEVLPVYEQIGDIRSRAITMGKIADILCDKGDLDEALRIRREEQLPAYQQIGDTRERAVTMGKIAEICYLRGDFDEALRIRQEEELPVYEQISDKSARAITIWKIGGQHWRQVGRETALAYLAEAQAAFRSMVMDHHADNVQTWIDHVKAESAEASDS